MGKTGKKQKILYKDGPNANSTKVVELEQFLFGSKADAALLFEQHDEVEAVATRGMPSAGEGAADDLGFFEDKRGEALSDEEVAEDEESEEAAGTSSSDEPEGEEEGGGVSRRQPRAHAAAREEERQLGARSKAGSKPKGRNEAVWTDPADSQLKVNIAAKSNLRKLRQSEGQKVVNGTQYEAALRKQHSILNPRTSWAASAAGDKRSKRNRGFGADSDSDADADADAGAGRGGLPEDGVGGAEQLLSSAGGLLGSSRGRGRRLAAGTIELSRLKDANQHEPSASVVSSVEWSPTGQLMMTAGLDKKIRLFQVDGSRNPIIQSIFLEDCPVHTARFASGGTQIIASGRRPFFYIYDVTASRIERVGRPLGCKLKSLESFATTPGAPEACGPAGPLAAFLGDQGTIPLVSLKSRQWIGNLKMSGTVRSAAFSSDGTELMTAGGDGVVYTWDMRMRRCVSQMVDLGNQDSASLALSSKFLATGSASGVVNVYNRAECRAGGGAAGGVGLLRRSSPTPIKEIMNLTTTADTLAFSPDSQILAVGSRMKKDALRLVHLPSCTVFSNWPTTRSPIHYVHSLAFSPNGGFLAVGNARGHVLLYRLHHYSEV